VLAGASPSIEPFFALAFSRHVLEGHVFDEINPLVEEELEKLGANGQTALARLRTGGSLGGEPEVPEALRRRFPIALEMSPQWHLRMQAAFQAFSDAGVSKTVNLPAGATVADVQEVFELANRLRLKGVTIYRDGSRQGQTYARIAQTSPDCRECAA
jgi:ribonucleoside-diphosphate reductase alpha chain